MGKKIIVNERQYSILLELIKEEMGIANEVLDISEKVKNHLYAEIDDGKSQGIFNVDGLNVVWVMYCFPDFDTFEEWIAINPKKYKNGFSYEEKLLYITVINVADTFNFDEIEDTIQHEVEHYYQTLKKGKDNNYDAYQVVSNNVYSNNKFISNLCWVLYYSNKFEIDAFINGGYAKVKNKRIGDFDDFLKETGLESIRLRMETCRNFFKNKSFRSVDCISMKQFIIKNSLFKFSDDKELRRLILKKIDDAYDYFIRKSARTYTLVIKQVREKIEFLLKHRNEIKPNDLFED